ncbi:MAG: hypothetical protein H6659_10550 [Ardenticatenaceae bacterium]|nr:hypothetical protein [Ardenticatenaceae bacterium]MCB8987501.1 hypothetical protein [Ardenticatenaceae bacterium]
MNLQQLLHDRETLIITEATESLARSQLNHYTAAGAAWNRQRLQALYDLVQTSIADRNLIPLVEYMDRVAHERFEAGFGIHEVQTAVNVLEESIWRQISQAISPDELAAAFGLASTVLGAAKDSLARAYVSLASRSKVPSLDLNALFEGVAS